MAAGLMDNWTGTAECRRWHILERAVVHRFQDLLHPGADHPPLVSRRMLLGLTCALTRLLGVDRFREWASEASRIVTGPPDEFADWRMQRLVNRCLIDLARTLEDFPRRLSDVQRLINGRLSAPQPDAWDTAWSLTRPTLLLVLDRMYADLREEWQRDGDEVIQTRYGADAPVVLRAVLNAIDQGARLAHRPWLLKAIGG
jgi:hypothetical protein